MNSVLRRQLNSSLSIYTDEGKLANCNFFIATVPTPINNKKKPDFTALKKVCETIGRLLKPNDTVIFESAVYPGATEEIRSTDILEKYSRNLESGKDFFLGYSPESSNPGDRVHTIDKINKVISGQNKNVEKNLMEIYSKVTSGKSLLGKKHAKAMLKPLK